MRNALLSLLFATAVHAETKTLIVSSVLADPSVVAPVVRMYRPNYEIGLSGWTIDGEWRRQITPTRTMVWAADITPIHAHNSNLIYMGGRRAPDLEYDNGSYRIRGGLRFGSQFDVRLVALYERIKGLHDQIGKRWRLPHHGVELTHTWGRHERIEVVSRGELFGGHLLGDQRGWSRLSVTENARHRIGRIDLVQSAAAMRGDGLDIVNRFVVGGSWDSLRATAVYGLRYGELRVQRAVIGSGGADYSITDNVRAGVRASWIDSDVTTTHGYAVHALTKWKHNAIDIGVGFPKSGDPVVYATLVVPLYSK